MVWRWRREREGHPNLPERAKSPPGIELAIFWWWDQSLDSYITLRTIGGPVKLFKWMQFIQNSAFKMTKQSAHIPVL